MALAAVDWAAWQLKAKAFLRAHPGVVAAELTRSERLVIPGAKEAWAVVHWGPSAGVRSLGGQPCAHCGEWTGSFCEGCSGLPAAICTRCDRERLLCPPCLEDGKLFQDVARGDDAGFSEITGYNEERGSFVRFEQPLRFPTADVPPNPDGPFNVDELMAFIERGERPGESHGTGARPSRS